MTARELLDELRAQPQLLAELRDLLGARPTVYTAQTLAAELGVTSRAIRAAIERGDLEAVRSGRVWLISAEAATTWASVRSNDARRRRVESRPLRPPRPMSDAFAGAPEAGRGRNRRVPPSEHLAKGLGPPEIDAPEPNSA